eukprot:m.82605 g.82605  ORF g.82605 m.82605 type:complete len:125 (-) comp12877_c1_seq1:57-431(-)
MAHVEKQEWCFIGDQDDPEPGKRCVATVGFIMFVFVFACCLGQYYWRSRRWRAAERAQTQRNYQLLHNHDAPLPGLRQYGAMNQEATAPPPLYTPTAPAASSSSVSGNNERNKPPENPPPYTPL